MTEAPLEKNSYSSQYVFLFHLVIFPELLGSLRASIRHTPTHLMSVEQKCIISIYDVWVHIINSTHIFVIRSAQTQYNFKNPSYAGWIKQDIQNISNSTLHIPIEIIEVAVTVQFHAIFAHDEDVII